MTSELIQGFPMSQIQIQFPRRLFLRSILLLGILVPAILLSAQSTGVSSPGQTELPRGVQPDGECEEPRPKGVIASIDGELIPSDQVEALVRPLIDSLQLQLKEDQFALVSRAIQNQLFSSASESQNMNLDDYFEAEIHSKIEEPQEIEVIQRGRNFPQLYGEDWNQARERITADLRRESAVSLGEQLVKELAEVAVIEWRIDFQNSQTEFISDDAIAVVDGVEVPWSSISQQWEDQEYQFELKIYIERRAQLDLLINSRLLELEARRQAVTTRELLAQRIDSQWFDVTDKEIEQFYGANQMRIADSLENTRASIREYLEQTRRHDLSAAFAQDLRSASHVVSFLEKPQPPVQDLGALDRTSLGPPEAPVTIVKFTDFRCGRCRELYSFLEELPSFYADQVRLVVRNKPLISLHPLALRAARAAESARRQGKFFEYTKVLFDRQADLLESQLDVWALELGLDVDQFRIDFDSISVQAVIEEDLALAERLGIHSTPVIFINGRRVSENTIEGILYSLQLEFRRLGLKNQ